MKCAIGSESNHRLIFPIYYIDIFYVSTIRPTIQNVFRVLNMNPSTTDSVIHTYMLVHTLGKDNSLKGFNTQHSDHMGQQFSKLIYG